MKRLLQLLLILTILAPTAGTIFAGTAVAGTGGGSPSTGSCAVLTIDFNDAGTLPSLGSQTVCSFGNTRTLNINPKASVENAGVAHNILIYDQNGTGDSLTFNICNPTAGRSADIFSNLPRFWGHLAYLGNNPGTELSKDPELVQTMKDAAAVNNGTTSTNGKCGELPADIATTTDRQTDRRATIQIDLNEGQWADLEATGRAADYPQWFPVSLVRKDTGVVVGYTSVNIPGVVSQDGGQVDLEFYTDASLPINQQLTPGEYNVQIFNRIFETITKTAAPYVDSGDEILDFQGGVSVDGNSYDSFYDWLLEYSGQLGVEVYPLAGPPAGSDTPIGATDPGAVVPGEEEVVESDPTCFTAGGFLSWILCPVLTILDESTQFLERQVQGFLFIDQEQFSRDGPLYQSWSSFRGIATVIIIIIAAIMIFSQAMGEGIFDNYSVKKLLPRLIMAGIAIQLSWFGMVLLIDIFNVLGDGIAGIMLNPFSPYEMTIDGTVTQVTLNADTNLRDLMGGMFRTASGGDFFTGLASVTIGGVALVAAFVALAIGAASALFIGFVVLIIRNMVILLGVVFSPIAIAMSVLPGTQKTSKWWWESFEKALMMYPLVMAVLSVGKILAVLLLGAAQSDSDEGIKMTYVMAAAIAWYGPFALLGKLGNIGGNALGKISGGIGDKSKGVFDKARGYNDARKKTNKEYKRTNAFNGEQQWWAKGRPLKAVGKGMNAANKASSYLESGGIGITNLKQSRVGRQQLEANAAAAKVKTNTFDLDAQKASLEAKEAELSLQNATAKLDRSFVQANEASVRSGGGALDQRSWLSDQVIKNGATGKDRDAVISKLTEIKATKDLGKVMEHMVSGPDATEDSRAAWGESMVRNKQSIKAFAPQIAEARLAPETIVTDPATGATATMGPGVATDKFFDDNLKPEDAKGWSKETWEAAKNARPSTVHQKERLKQTAEAIYKNQTQWDSMGGEAQAHLKHVLTEGGTIPLPARTF